MAIGATCRNVCSLMVRICRGIIIGLMTRNAFFGNIGEGTVRMASAAIEVSMTQLQWEKIVVHIGGSPGNTVIEWHWIQSFENSP